jgi:hypothetical protein
MYKDLTQQEGQPAESRTEKVFVCFSCVTFFPLVYIIGKTVMSLM